MENKQSLRAALIRQRVWIEHWLEDVRAGLAPTDGSLRAALAMIEVALADVEVHMETELSFRVA